MNKEKLPDSKIIFALGDKIIDIWHQKEKTIDLFNGVIQITVRNNTAIELMISDLQTINCYLWHIEDEARRTDISDSKIASIKRLIDASNQKRHNKIEEIDKSILEYLNRSNLRNNKKAEINSETPGNIIDRLTVLNLKIYHMKAETNRKDSDAIHAKNCGNKLKILIEQKKDLSGCFDGLIDDLKKGRKTLKLYFQFKMYNDPSTNPAVYSRKNTGR